MNKVFITGAPGIGKSTLIYKLIEIFKNQKKNVDGFLTPEVKVGGKRIGFDLERITTGEVVPLARINQPNTPFHVRRYGVLVDELENFIENFRYLNDSNIDFYLIDEIGKMELLSIKFRAFITDLIKSDVKLIATIGKTLLPNLLKEWSNCSSFKVYKLTRANRDTIILEILRLFRLDLSN